MAETIRFQSREKAKELVDKLASDDGFRNQITESKDIKSILTEYIADPEDLPDEFPQLESKEYYQKVLEDWPPEGEKWDFVGHLPYIFLPS